ncbi:VOC family protein [Glutamicibacter sp. NPDC087344]|uniref:VOC family protein n=1 Tax=Glutamicibacter sp. NPDC087344 TaxID=3363994 RepID=UPI00382E1F8D
MGAEPPGNLDAQTTQLVDLGARVRSRAGRHGALSADPDGNEFRVAPAASA